MPLNCSPYWSWIYRTLSPRRPLPTVSPSLSNSLSRDLIFESSAEILSTTVFEKFTPEQKKQLQSSYKSLFYTASPIVAISVGDRLDPLLNKLTEGYYETRKRSYHATQIIPHARGVLIIEYSAGPTNGEVEEVFSSWKKD